MTLLSDNFIIDGCIFAEGEFEGCSKDIFKSGLNSFFLTVPYSSLGFRAAVRSIAKVYDLNDEGFQNLKIAKGYNDLIKSRKDNKISIIFAFQDPAPIENSLELLRVFYELGVRVIQLTYNKANYLGTGAIETIDRGLTDFGKKAILEMNRLGIIIDLSHCSLKTAIDAMTISQMPVIYSHANVKAITDNPRNKTDEELKMLKDLDGVIGLSPWGPLCWKKEKRTQPVLEDYLDHIDYVVNLIGIDHVGFGSDNTIDYNPDIKGIAEQSLLYPSVVEEYNKYVGTNPEVRHAIGFKGVQEINNVIDGLLKRGYKEEDVSKFLGENFLRIIKQVWKQGEIK